MVPHIDVEDKDVKGGAGNEILEVLSTALLGLQ